jgi:hypothetical protein
MAIHFRRTFRRHHRGSDQLVKGETTMKSARRWVCAYTRYHADHADIGAGLVGAAWSSVMALSISEPRLA